MKRPTTLKEALQGKLTYDELGKLRRAYDIIGDIAILEIPEELVDKEKLIAETLLSMHKNVNVVCKKAGIHEGEFRTQRMQVLAGEERKETVHKENNSELLLNVETCYFSPRLSTERKRIAALIRPEEKVLVMFSGVGPYPIVFSRNTPASEIIGVEKNPHAHEYGLQNIKRNKVKNVTLFLGDVRDIVPGLGIGFERVLMPLPKQAEDFLDVAIHAVKDGGMLHFYDFLPEEEFETAVRKIELACKRAGRDARVERIIACGQHAPRVYRVCVDAVITGKF